VLDVLRQYYLGQAPLSPSKVYRASTFIQLGASQAEADGGL
jgi:hypothetical protein